MKAVCIRANNYCAVLMDDRGEVDLSGDPAIIANMRIAGVPGSAFIVHDDVTEVSSGVTVLKGTSWKADLWVGDKFTYDGSTWALNSNNRVYICNKSVGLNLCETEYAYNATVCPECGTAVL